ncbi:P-loop containing nucleoside triphosphate hydrolases superfamily protein [Artemisia annua]|uniref:P-loop containing nucleoside triphosphate hydrolases superfamily protein n=1 Tax=Artemisia annua TaxID=35608 RepID=A0A2U1MYY2_ARTAN|nr:P-loop containing nucleoside triphosphate hydrolases superfamily protein [Artemisia annua]
MSGHDPAIPAIPGYVRPRPGYSGQYPAMSGQYPANTTNIRLCPAMTRTDPHVVGIDDVDKLARQPNSIVISCILKLNLEAMRLVRVTRNPVVLSTDRGGCSVEDFCNQIHISLVKEVKYVYRARMQSGLPGWRRKVKEEDGKVVGKLEHEEGVLIAEIHLSAINHQRQCIPLQKHRRHAIYKLLQVDEQTP